MYLFDDSAVDYAALAAMQEALTSDDLNAGPLTGGGPPPPPGPGGTNNVPPPPPLPPGYWTNLLVLITNLHNHTALLRLTNTVPGTWYELLTRPGVTGFPWSFVEIDQATGKYIGYDSINPIQLDNPANAFFRAVGGNTSVGIYANSSFHHAIRPIQQGGTRTIAKFDVTISPAVNYDFTLVFTIGGSAVNNVDYTNIGPSLRITHGTTSTNIVIDPLARTTSQFDETVILSLVLTNGYLVDPGNPSAQVIISDATNTQWYIVATNDFPADVDYHPTNKTLIISANVDFAGYPSNFLRLDTNANLQTWSGVKGLTDEIKIAVVPRTTNGFNAGDMYFAVDRPGAIGWASGDGKSWNTNWLNLPETNYLKGSLYFDRTGIWSNSLIAVAGDGFNAGSDNYKGVWMIDAQKHTNLVASILSSQLEGIITLPNDPRYGPWAGKLLVGDEAGRLIHAISTNGVITDYPLGSAQGVPQGIAVSDLDLIGTNQTLYATDPVAGLVIKKPASAFSAVLGDILVTVSGEDESGGGPGAIYIIHWDSTQQAFTVRTVPPPPFGSTLFEHSGFAPIDVRAIGP